LKVCSVLKRLCDIKVLAVVKDSHTHNYGLGSVASSENLLDSGLLSKV
jgi:hypothetical protein